MNELDRKYENLLLEYSKELKLNLKVVEQGFKFTYNNGTLIDLVDMTAILRYMKKDETINFLVDKGMIYYDSIENYEEVYQNFCTNKKNSNK